MGSTVNGRFLLPGGGGGGGGGRGYASFLPFFKLGDVGSFKLWGVKTLSGLRCNVPDHGWKRRAPLWQEGIWLNAWGLGSEEPR